MIKLTPLLNEFLSQQSQPPKVGQLAEKFPQQQPPKVGQLAEKFPQQQPPKVGQLAEQLPQLSNEEKTKLMEMISTYNSLGEQLYRENKLVELAKKLSEITSAAKNVVLGENGEWFNKKVINEDMKRMETYCEQFSKVAYELDESQQMIEALYENMGHLVQRYFDIKPYQGKNPTVDSEVQNTSIAK